MIRKIIAIILLLAAAELLLMLPRQQAPQVEFIPAETKGAVSSVALESATITAEVKRENQVFSRVGEATFYEVRLGQVLLGKAKFSHTAVTQHKGVPANVMTFETRLVRFSDVETIYSSLDDLLPLTVERDVYLWPGREKIIEEYDQKGFTLNIRKSKGKRQEELVIKKNGPIHNAILLPYYVRNIPQLYPGWSMIVNLPTRQFEIHLAAIEQVRVPAGEFKAFRFESKPKKFEIWISADEKRIPLKIKGMGNLGYTLLIKKHSFQQ
jgi:hypothetical protein